MATTSPIEAACVSSKTSHPALPQHPKDESLDFATEMTQLTFKIVSMALFSLDISDRSSELGQACRYAIIYVYERISNLIYCRY